ncbi:hypothetical protein TTY48_31580 [Tsukamurella sp. TY48]|nr:hypothetical protein TTY48_31580 [Tsukamurella sp. TY48]
MSLTMETRVRTSIRTARPMVRIESTTVLEKFLLMMDQYEGRLVAPALPATVSVTASVPSRQWPNCDPNDTHSGV